MKAIYFDMDGTIANLFAVKGWKNTIDNNDATPYREARKMYDADAMAEVIAELKANGYTIGIITYVAYGADNAFANEVRRAKREWLKANFPYADEIHMVGHNTPKWKVAKIHDAILVDDCKANREVWKWGNTINAYRADLVAELKKVVENA